MRCPPVLRAALAIFASFVCEAQVYSPVVLKSGQVDATDLRRLAYGIYEEANAITPRDRAEAIWRFFLTDGRFVQPGFWYHIAGWAYEEPKGEVLDPIKLLNSYGFGLCYHLAPLLEAVWEAGGFEGARVWFLTGHTVAEVFYDGAYHYFDSDMMGYNPLGTGPLKARPVASVRQIERDGSIILGKLSSPREVDLAAVDQPWYPADVRADAIAGLADLFTTVNDNWVFPFQRYSQGHSMDFALRPGERMTRYFRPETGQGYYLPFKFDGSNWTEFPREISEYQIRTIDGPRSQKDTRLWATGRIEYRPPPSALAAAIAQEPGGSVRFGMPCPYVVIDAQFSIIAHLKTAQEHLSVATSVDGGRAWTKGAALDGPFEGQWTTSPAVILKSEHGKLTAVSGSYGYLVRFTFQGDYARGGMPFDSPVLTTTFQVNPRTLPDLVAGHNQVLFGTANQHRTEFPILASRISEFASRTANVSYQSAQGQGYLINATPSPGVIYFELKAPEGGEMSGFDAGGRFLDLRGGLAPDKLTAEVRNVTPWPGSGAPAPHASIAWSPTIDGSYTTVWNYNPEITWKDGDPVERTLRWPEVDRHVSGLPAGIQRVFVRYEIEGMAIDDIRLAVNRSGLHASCPVAITHHWKEDGMQRKFVKVIPVSNSRMTYTIDTSPGANIENEAVEMECLQAGGAAPSEDAVVEAVRAPQDVAPDPNPQSAFWRVVRPVLAANDNFGRPVPGHRTEIRARWTEQNLYLLFVCPYQKLNFKPKPSTSAETKELWNWDVAEAFIGSDFQNVRRYKEFEMSPQGEWVDLDIDLDKPHPAEGWVWNSGFQVAARIDAASKTWYGCMRIPYRAVDTRPAVVGNLLRVNFYRSQGPESDRKEISWRPTMTETFHVPASFGILKLVEPNGSVERDR